jgi:hypothetical protein
MRVSLKKRRRKTEGYDFSIKNISGENLSEIASAFAKMGMPLIACHIMKTIGGGKDAALLALHIKGTADSGKKGERNGARE